MADVVKICNRSCNQCLFTANRIVSEARAEEVIQQALASDTYFECHKATLAGHHVVCRGFWNNHKKDSLLLRLTLWLNKFIFVDVDNLKED